jgi:hypothetical protein
MVQTTPVPITKVANAVAGQVYRISDTGIPPAGTVWGYFMALVTQATNTVGGEKLWGDLLTLEYGTTDGSWFGPAASFTGTVDASTSVVATKQIAYADGGSPGWSWEGTANASPSTGPVSYVPDRVNLATNPGYESGTANIFSNAGSIYVPSAETVAPIGGTRSILFTRAASPATSMIASIVITTQPTQVNFPVTAGQPITGAISIKTDVANAVIRTCWYWYDASSVLTQGTRTIRVAAATPGTVYRVVDNGTPLADTVKAFFIVEVSTSGGNVVGGEKVWADYLTLENGTTDGSWF